MNLDNERKKILHDLDRIRKRNRKMYVETINQLRATSADSLQRLYHQETRERELVNLEKTREKMVLLKSKYPALYNEFMDNHYFPAKERAEKQMRRRDRAFFLREVDILALRYGIRDVVLRWDSKGKRTRLATTDIDVKRVPNEMLMVAREYVDHPQGWKKLMRKYKISEKLARALIQETK